MLPAPDARRHAHTASDKCTHPSADGSMSARREVTYRQCVVLVLLASAKLFGEIYLFEFQREFLVFALPSVRGWADMTPRTAGRG